MASDRGWYLVAVGVLALGLGNSLANRRPDWLQSLADRSAATIERASAEAERYLAIAQLMLGQGESGFGRAQATLGSLQAHLGIMQANLARHQAEMARLEAADARMVTVRQVRQTRVVCPRVVVQLSQVGR